MLKHILTAMFTVFAIIAGVGMASAQTYSFDRIEADFPKQAKAEVKFLECRKNICGFQSETPLAAVFFLTDETAQNIRMLSVTFHFSKAHIASALIKDALRFAQYPRSQDIDVPKLIKDATPSGKDVDIQAGLGAKLVNLVNVDKNVFSIRFYRTEN